MKEKLYTFDGTQERLPPGTVVKLMGGDWDKSHYIMENGQQVIVDELSGDEIGALGEFSNTAIPVLDGQGRRWWVYTDKEYNFPCLVLEYPDTWECFDCREKFRSEKIHYLCPICRENQ